MATDRHQQVLNELVNWLVGVEEMAHEVYTAAAEVLGEDRHLANFVARLSKDEADHGRWMCAVRERIATGGHIPPSELRLDKAQRERVEAPLRRLQAETAAGRLTPKRAVSLIAEVEFTEWNDIFLYVLRTFGKRGREMQAMSAAIQEHERSIEAFIASRPPETRPQRDVARLAKVWDTRLLLVDDSPLILELLSGLLKASAQIVTAENGEKALAATRSHFFDAVVSDIQMSGMSGIEFYEQAVAEHPDLEKRFVFMSFDPSPAAKVFLANHHLPLLNKPFSPDELFDIVDNITTRKVP